MPQLGAHNASHDRYSNHAYGVGANVCTAKAAVHNKSSRYGRKP